ncbi:MAG: prenylated flavin chaperone LpdD [Anaerolineae bacterium]
MTPSSASIIQVTRGTGRHAVCGIAVRAGDDLVVTITGGDVPHIGAVGLGIPRPSLRDPARMSATSSVLSLTGHRDDELAKPLAEEAAARLGHPVVLVVGVHVADATGADIALLSDHVRQALATLLEALGAP